MTLFWSIVVWAVMLPVLPIVYFMQKNECKPKKNIIAGVTLPYEAQRDEEVLAMLERYRRELKRMCWVMLAAMVPSLFFRSVGLFMTYYVTWAVALCAVFAVPYIRCNKSLRQLKEKRGWRRTEEASQVVTDLKAAAEEMRWLSPWWFLPPFLIALVPLAFEREVWWAWTICAALVPAFYLCYRHLYRNRAEVVDADSQRTMALTRIRRYNWGKVWLVTAWATGLFNVLLWLTLDHVWLCMGLCLLYGAVIGAEAVGSHFGGEWSVALEDIAEVRVLEERPPLRRVAGTGMESALTGQFNADGWGRVTCCIDPRTGPWLLVTAEDGKLFLFGASEEGAVEEIAAKLT